VKRRAPAERAAVLERYRGLVARYHRTLDLMSDRGVARLDEHLEDAEAYVAAVAALSPAPRRLLDLGSGAGLPGVALAAAFPALPIELVERRRKRGAFLRMAVAAVAPSEAEVRVGDVRDTGGEAVDVVTAQAVGTLLDAYRLTCHRHAPTVVLMARKGPAWRAELDRLGAELGAAPEVLASRELPHRGTLVAVRVQGGVACRSSA
jgi:16S rRNA (guanine527-N7)-methyltransferase